MQFQIPIHIPKLDPAISYHDDIMLVGSCFTEHIGKFLEEDKFNILQNPNGIVFDPISISKNVISWIENHEVDESELFCQNEVWHHWDFHSCYSSLRKDEALRHMNRSIAQAHQYLQKADWLILTLGTSYSYRLKDKGQTVANCHKVPANQFDKHLCTIEESVHAFDIMLYRLWQFNPDLKIIFTVSPVRHIKDGIVENNLSKARLLEVVHHLVGKFERLYYFPSYEIVIDVLRDYRFYDIDLVHPNYAGTSYVLEQFKSACMSVETISISEKMHQIFLAKKHKPFNPTSEQHQKFLKKNYELCWQLSKDFPQLDFSKELQFFQNDGQ